MNLVGRLRIIFHKHQGEEIIYEGDQIDYQKNNARGMNLDSGQVRKCKICGELFMPKYEKLKRLG